MNGLIFNIQRYSLQDGPGIRTTVFFKGCPLRCLWCSNPESQNSTPEIAHRNSLCNNCGRCLEVCEVKAISLIEKGIKIERERCNNCGKCVEVCTPGALKVFGQEVTVEGVFEEVRRDELFYRNSGGGVTVSGGEPLQQWQFVTALLKKCQAEGIHTCLDTCGYASPRALERVLDYVDLVLFDLKLVDSEAHRKVTERSNKPILRNVRTIAKRGIPVLIRVPLIPGVNDSEDNLRATAGFVSSLDDGRVEVNLLPYHRFGVGKYEMLDRPYLLSGLTPFADEEVQKRRQIFESLGLSCKIVV